MKTIALTLTTLFAVANIHAQTVELPQTIISLNYKYIDNHETNNTPIYVKKLESEVLNYNHKDEISELYDDEYDTYSVSFHIPKGKIVAAYDKNGKIIRTIEKYNNVRLPLEVMQAVSKRFPNWAIVEDVYLVKYHYEVDTLKQEYKIKIKNDDQTIMVKTNEKGLFL
ncbi:nicotinate-nucleotide adenylyltransferase [uncultured Algibacter sp.]|uniref:nicotinate-nucleotide adenylyltransferase n=1 Tax=uncultured Algibacter sp. TaxID=298659 RepID=UPI002633D424|nr:nicotinate-nucleotide adenylyltransferase [uncultured Algibacter sp.]